MPREIPPPLELQCLKALWELGEANVKDVRSLLTGNRKLAYTTVMTVLDRLERRGGVRRRKIGRSFVYTPTLSRESLRQLALKEFVDSFFDGSTDSLKDYLEAAGPDAVEFPDVLVEVQMDTSLL
ncbi:MAG: BlaI/MecI/CopY family transcriptional regulator [Bryobacteraceae bacterium]